MCVLIDINPCIYLRRIIERKKKLLQSLIKCKPDELTVDDYYNMALDIQKKEQQLVLLIQHKRDISNALI